MRRSSGRAAGPRGRRPVAALPRRVRDRVARGVELVRAVLLRVGPAAGRGEPPRERHAGELAQRLRRTRGTSTTASAPTSASTDSTVSPSWRSVITKWWKSSCRSATTTPGSTVTTRMRRRYASASRSKSGRGDIGVRVGEQCGRWRPSSTPTSTSTSPARCGSITSIPTGATTRCASSTTTSATRG